MEIFLEDRWSQIALSWDDNPRELIAWLGPGIDCKRARTKAVMFWKPIPHHLRECLIHNSKGAALRFQALQR
jgi:hypothetical protein